MTRLPVPNLQPPGPLSVERHWDPMGRLATQPQRLGPGVAFDSRGVTYVPEPAESGTSIRWFKPKSGGTITAADLATRTLGYGTGVVWRRDPLAPGTTFVEVTNKEFLVFNIYPFEVEPADPLWPLQAFQDEYNDYYLKADCLIPIELKTDLAPGGSATVYILKIDGTRTTHEETATDTQGFYEGIGSMEGGIVGTMEGDGDKGRCELLWDGTLKFETLSCEPPG